MILLDENIPADQVILIRKLHIPARQIGGDVAKCGIKDPEIVPLLHQLRNVTFFTQDRRFYLKANPHPAYCFVLLDIRADVLAHYVRHFLRHKEFRSSRLRMGLVARVHPDGIEVHRWKSKQPENLAWFT